MLRRFLKDSAIYATAGLLSQGIAFVMFPFFAHVLKPHEYGAIDILGLLTTLVYLTVALEINQGLGRYVADLDDPRERSGYASTALIYSAISYTVFAALALGFAPTLTKTVLGADVNVWIMRVGIVGMWVGGVLYLVQDQLRWQLRPKAFATVSVLNAAVTTASSGIYILALHAGALGAIGGQLTGAAGALLLAAVLSKGTYRLRFDRAKCRRMLSFSLPLVPSSIGVFLNGYADRLAILHEGSLAEVGVYGVGFRISIAITLLLLGVQGATTPLVLARHRDPSTPHDLARAFRIFCAVGCVASLALSVLAVPLVRVLAAPEYAAAASVVPFLVLGAFLSGLYVFAPGPTIAAKTRVYAGANVGAGLINLGLAFALVPALGIRGAGIAFLVSSAFAFVVTMAVSQRLYPVPHVWGRIALAFALATGIAVATRATLDHGSGSALDAAPLLARIGVCVLGAILIGAIMLTREDLHGGRGILSAAVHRRARAGIEA